MRPFEVFDESGLAGKGGYAPLFTLVSLDFFTPKSPVLTRYRAG